MADLADTLVDTSKVDEMASANTGNEPFSLDRTKYSARYRDEAGVWKNVTDSIELIENRNTDVGNVNFPSENSTEWKYKNLYSISAQSGGQLGSWGSLRLAALANAIGTKSNDVANDAKSYLAKFREQLANYQECYGIPRSEYTFPALIKVMGQATGRSLLALLYVLVNITPMAQILLHILRFVLDKTISIQNTNDLRQKILKYAILGLQLLCIYVCLVFIFGFIVMPILYMALGIIVKIMLYD